MVEMEEDQVVVEEEQVMVGAVGVVEDIALKMVVLVRTLIFLYHAHQACPGHPDP